MPTPTPAVDSDGDGAPFATDCNDDDPTVFPGAVETCNDVDDDCDSGVDEDLEIVAYYLDSDSDGYGAEGSDPVQTCDGPPEGYVESADDCDDSDPEIYPGGAGCPWISELGTCLDILNSGLSEGDGIYALNLSSGPADVYCDMSGGGWTLLARYVSNQEIHAWDHTVHQVQNNSGGAVVDHPPRIWEEGVYGHVAYIEMPIAGRALRLQCRTTADQEWFSVTHDALIDAWGQADYGTYGAGEWGIIGGADRGRSNHFICGVKVNTGIYRGIGYCSGTGGSSVWTNHEVSFSFADAAHYGGKVAIGCNGAGLNNGGSAAWEGQVWLR